MHCDYCSFIQHVPLTMKKSTITSKIARTYDEERAYKICVSDIIKWRKTTSLTFKVPKKKMTEKMMILIKEVQRKLFVERSPEEETCKMALKNCLHNRDQLISQLYMQLNK